MRVLYITYDGILESIGQAQVLPYLERLGDTAQLHLLTFEKPGDWKNTSLIAATRRRLQQAGIQWHPHTFQSRPPLIAKLFDSARLVSATNKIVLKYSIDAIHCRSYVAAQGALAAKRKHGTPYIFDMRGFWVDERREGGRWKSSNPFYSLLYRRWKHKENQFIENAAEIVVLTKAAKQTIGAWPSYRGQPVSVIRCRVDHERFQLHSSERRATSRRELGITDNNMLLVYLGSLGTIYKLTDMLRFFERLKQHRPNAKFLFIGKHRKAMIEEQITAKRLELSEDDILVRPLPYEEVPAYLAAADLAIAFRKPTFSSRAASPTKLGEYFACGLPVITNAGVGDVGRIVTTIDAGHVTSPEITNTDLDLAVQATGNLLLIERERIRNASIPLHDIEDAIASYKTIYRRVRQHLNSTGEDPTS